MELSLLHRYTLCGAWINFLISSQEGLRANCVSLSCWSITEVSLHWPFYLLSDYAHNCILCVRSNSSGRRTINLVERLPRLAYAFSYCWRLWSFREYNERLRYFKCLVQRHIRTIRWATWRIWSDGERQIFKVNWYILTGNFVWKSLSVPDRRLLGYLVKFCHTFLYMYPSSIAVKVIILVNSWDETSQCYCWVQFVCYLGCSHTFAKKKEE